MYCVMWTYLVPSHITKDVIERQFMEVADRYLTIPGLIRKYFCYSEDVSTVVGIYLWTSQEDADRFYTEEWMAGVKQRWGAAPAKLEWLVPVVAESKEGKVIT